MKRLTLLMAMFVATILVVPTVGPAFADQAGCDLGTYNIGTDECEISGATTTTGVKNFHHTVRMLTGSSINASGGGITLNINGDAGLDFIMDPSTSVLEANDDIFPPNADGSAININVTGDMTMGTGTKILAENNTAGGDGGDITIDVDGNMSMAGASGPDPGALISTRKDAGAGDTGVAGDISITVGDINTFTGAFFMGGGDTTYGAETGAKLIATGTGPSGDIDVTAGKTITTEPGSVVEAGDGHGSTIQQGGKIFLVSGCGLTSEGRVTSKGPDPGADLVHLESCDVLITGLVESTGKGHTANAPNSCDDVDDGLVGEVFRPGKPANTTGCIEVWGNNITIDSTNGRAGELNADIGNGGSQGESWIDVFALSSLLVSDGTGNDRVTNNGGGPDNDYFNTFAVHAKGMAGSDQTPNDVTAKVTQGPLTSTGDGFMAGSDDNGSNGGTVVIESRDDLNIDTVKVGAGGDGAAGDGGSIGVRSYDGDLTWQNGDGDVDGNPNGTINLSACGTVTTTGSNFHAVVPTTATGVCGGMPALPAYVGTFFDSTSNWDGCAEFATKSGVKFDDINHNGMRDPTDPLLEGWIIHMFNNSVEFTDTTDANGAYSFTVPPGTYTVCEEMQPGWTQVWPNPGTDGATCEDHTHGGTLTMGAWGYSVTLLAGENHADNDFGNDPKPFCEKQPVQDVLDPITGRFPGNLGPDVTVRPDLGHSVQTAVNTATDTNLDGYIIIGVVNNAAGTLGGHTTQDLVISQNYPQTFALIGCSVTLHDPSPNDTNPTIRIASTANSPGNIFLMDLHAADSKAAGVVVEGNGRYLRNEDAYKNGTGFKLLGNSNTMHNGSAESNSGAGVYVLGNGNILSDADAYANGGHGFHIVGNSNQLLKLDSGEKGKGNKGDGLNVAGSGNTLTENDAFANTGDGIEVSGGTAGAPNLLKKNRAGDSGKGNGGNGFLIAGAGNGTPNPVELEENTARSNVLNGFRITGTGHELKKNVSGGSSGLDNGDCEFLVGAGNFNAKDNKYNAAGTLVLPNTDGAAFPTACQGTP